MRKKELRKRFIIFTLIFAFLISVILLTHNTAPVRNSIIIVRGPAYVVKRFYIAANHGRYNEAISYMSSEARSTFSILGSDRYDVLATMSRKGKKIRSLITTKEKIYKTEANVAIRINYMDGVSLTKTATLIKERGIWKISSE